MFGWMILLTLLHSARSYKDVNMTSIFFSLIKLRKEFFYFTSVSFFEILLSSAKFCKVISNFTDNQSSSFFDNTFLTLSHKIPIETIYF